MMGCARLDSQRADDLNISGDLNVGNYSIMLELWKQVNSLVEPAPAACFPKPARHQANAGVGHCLTAKKVSNERYHEQTQCP
ncbi:MAG: hypothetical protein CAPSK01_002007 [Candidatus Accumulibacter vicinus]|uniref:Uncharacterized protein n=1 Tax=Candidatus Accumulibacter vicinus TaxID=2954382 RepID=A0A084Y0B1_9PROT|nr:MAG: hypothetical protein CAPSK01_002007 [Candidatus Accumulibacter vicinus]